MSTPEERRELRRLIAKRKRRESLGYEPRNYTPHDESFARRLSVGFRMLRGAR